METVMIKYTLEQYIFLYDTFIACKCCETYWTKLRKFQGITVAVM